MTIQLCPDHSAKAANTPAIERLLRPVDPSWHACLHAALNHLPIDYLNWLVTDKTWLPDADKLLNAFCLPLSNIRYILFGESPYPREQSANGYAFWDNAVTDVWSEQGLSKRVNRATSLRHLVKMLLIAQGCIPLDDATQPTIANADKKNLVTHVDELFNNMQQQGILLLNACPVLGSKPVVQEARTWRPFLGALLGWLAKKKPDTTLILLGNIAKKIELLPQASPFPRFCAEHPYNVSFMTNLDVIDFFRPMGLLLSKM